MIAGASVCAVVVYVAVNLALEGLARQVEVRQHAYLWWQEEWMQLFGPANFVARGEHRILLSGSSEGREGFLADEIAAELQGFDVYNNSYSRNGLTAFLLSVDYIEKVYGPSAMPRKIVLAITPEFLMNQPPIESSYLPDVIDRYSPYVNVDLRTSPPRLVDKGWIDSAAARYRLLTHQSRRYQGAARGVMRAAVGWLAPDLSVRYRVRFKLGPAYYHHLPPRDKAEHLERARRSGLRMPDPVERAESVRAEWAALERFVSDRKIALYVVSMPQSTWWIKQFYETNHDEYREILRGVVGQTPFVDLADFLHDDEFYDMTHANLASARRISHELARFVRETDEASGNGESGGVH